jgi:hypothetical protein
MLLSICEFSENGRNIANIFHLGVKEIKFMPVTWDHMTFEAGMSRYIVGTMSGITLVETELTIINTELLIMKTAEDVWVKQRLCES